jgi:hypothetical protein
VLSTYLRDTSALLNDLNFTFTSQNQMTVWINESRRNLAKRTPCVRRLITGQSAFGASSQPGMAIPGAMQPGMIPGSPAPLSNQLTVTGAQLNACQTIPNVERYPYEGFFNLFLRQEYAGCDCVIDSISLAVNWGGVDRPALDYIPWDDFQAYCRAYAVLNTTYPAVWSVYNDGPQGEIWMFPVPSTYGEIELDCQALPIPLYLDSDPEAVPKGFREAIKFKAASLCYMASRRYADAQVYENMFADTCGLTRVAVDGGKVSSYYGAGY